MTKKPENAIIKESDAKTGIINHYIQSLGAKVISGRRMTIEGKSSRDLYDRYFGDAR